MPAGTPIIEILAIGFLSYWHIWSVGLFLLVLYVYQRLANLDCSGAIGALVRRPATANLAKKRATAPIAAPGSAPPGSGSGQTSQQNAAQQWQRVTGMIETAIERNDRIEVAQRGASRQLDAAEYALDRLIADLAGVIGKSPATGHSVATASLWQAAEPALAA